MVQEEVKPREAAEEEKEKELEKERDRLRQRLLQLKKQREDERRKDGDRAEGGARTSPTEDSLSTFKEDGLGNSTRKDDGYGMSRLLKEDSHDNPRKEDLKTAKAQGSSFGLSQRTENAESGERQGPARGARGDPSDWGRDRDGAGDGRRAFRDRDSVLSVDGNRDLRVRDDGPIRDGRRERRDKDGRPLADGRKVSGNQDGGALGDGRKDRDTSSVGDGRTNDRGMERGRVDERGQALGARRTAEIGMGAEFPSRQDAHRHRRDAWRSYQGALGGDGRGRDGRDGEQGKDRAAAPALPPRDGREGEQGRLRSFHRASSNQGLSGSTQKSSNQEPQVEQRGLELPERRAAEVSSERSRKETGASGERDALISREVLPRPPQRRFSKSGSSGNLAPLQEPGEGAAGASGHLKGVVGSAGGQAAEAGAVGSGRKGGMALKGLAWAGLEEGEEGEAWDEEQEEARRGRPRTGTDREMAHGGEGGTDADGLEGHATDGHGGHLLPDGRKESDNGRPERKEVRRSSGALEGSCPAAEAGGLGLVAGPRSTGKGGRLGSPVARRSPENASAGAEEIEEGELPDDSRGGGSPGAGESRRQTATEDASYGVDAPTGGSPGDGTPGKGLPLVGAADGPPAEAAGEEGGLRSRGEVEEDEEDEEEEEDEDRLSLEAHDVVSDDEDEMEDKGRVGGRGDGGEGTRADRETYDKGDVHDNSRSKGEVDGGVAEVVGRVDDQDADEGRASQRGRGGGRMKALENEGDEDVGGLSFSRPKMGRDQTGTVGAALGLMYPEEDNTADADKRDGDDAEDEAATAKPSGAGKNPSRHETPLGMLDSTCEFSWDGDGAAVKKERVEADADQADRADADQAEGRGSHSVRRERSWKEGKARGRDKEGAGNKERRGDKQRGSKERGGIEESGEDKESRGNKERGGIQESGGIQEMGGDTERVGEKVGVSGKERRGKGRLPVGHSKRIRESSEVVSSDTDEGSQPRNKRWARSQSEPARALSAVAGEDGRAERRQREADVEDEVRRGGTESSGGMNECANRRVGEEREEKREERDEGGKREEEEKRRTEEKREESKRADDERARGRETEGVSKADANDGLRGSPGSRATDGSRRDGGSSGRRARTEDQASSEAVGQVGKRKPEDEDRGDGEREAKEGDVGGKRHDRQSVRGEYLEPGSQGLSVTQLEQQDEREQSKSRGGLRSDRDGSREACMGERDGEGTRGDREGSRGDREGSRGDRDREGGRGDREGGRGDRDREGSRKDREGNRGNREGSRGDREGSRKEGKIHSSSAGDQLRDPGMVKATGAQEMELKRGAKADWSERVKREERQERGQRDDREERGQRDVPEAQGRRARKVTSEARAGTGGSKREAKKVDLPRPPARQRDAEKGQQTRQSELETRHEATEVEDSGRGQQNRPRGEGEEEESRRRGGRSSDSRSRGKDREGGFRGKEGEGSVRGKEGDVAMRGKEGDVSLRAKEGDGALRSARPAASFRRASSEKSFRRQDRDPYGDEPLGQRQLEGRVRVPGAEERMGHSKGDEDETGEHSGMQVKEAADQGGKGATRGRSAPPQGGHGRERSGKDEGSGPLRKRSRIQWSEDGDGGSVEKMAKQQEKEKLKGSKQGRRESDSEGEEPEEGREPERASQKARAPERVSQKAREERGEQQEGASESEQPDEGSEDKEAATPEVKPAKEQQSNDLKEDREIDEVELETVGAEGSSQEEESEGGGGTDNETDRDRETETVGAAGSRWGSRWLEEEDDFAQKRENGEVVERGPPGRDRGGISRVDESDESEEDEGSGARRGGVSSSENEDEESEEEDDDRPALHAAVLSLLQGCRSVDEFDRLDVLGEGVYGVVHRARDKSTGEVYALKRVKLEKEREGFPLTSLREINILLSLHHPAIVGVKEVVVNKGLDRVFMVMEYVEHEMKVLMETMKQPFALSEVKSLVLQLLQGLEYMHQSWVLHRDIKTSNILMNNRGQVKFCDFGLARQYGQPLRPYTQPVVTLWYRAPELLLGKKEYSTAIDVWSMGCVMAEFLLKKPLFKGESDLEQINKIFAELGMPTSEVWPEFSSLPACQKVKFSGPPTGKLRDRFPVISIAGRPSLSEAGFDLLSRMLTYDPRKRITAEDAVNHPWFKEQPLPKAAEDMPKFRVLSEAERKRRRAMRSPDPLKELQRQERLRAKKGGQTGLFGQ